MLEALLEGDPLEDAVEDIPDAGAVNPRARGRGRGRHGRAARGRTRGWSKASRVRLALRNARDQAARQRPHARTYGAAVAETTFGLQGVDHADAMANRSTELCHVGDELITVGSLQDPTKR